MEGCLGGAVPWDFCLEGEGDTFFGEGDADFAGVGGAGGGVFVLVCVML